GRLLRTDGQGDQPERLGQGPACPGTARGSARLQDHRRHYAGVEPVYRRVLPGSPADEPDDARDVLPDGGTARSPVDAVPRRRWHSADTAALHGLPRPPDEVRRVHEAGRALARRPVRLLLPGVAGIRKSRPAPRATWLLGILHGSRGVRLPVSTYERVGPGDV